MALGFRRMSTEGQVGDGREESLARYVEAKAQPGSLDDAIRVIDEFCYGRSVMMNVGDEKGEILDRAIRQARPRRLLELGTYCGYSALRMTRVMPRNARVWSIELNPANARIARRIWDHAGVGQRVQGMVGSLGDGGQTIASLDSAREFGEGGLDFVFLDHDKDAYLHDLQRILDCQWLHAGSVVVADNVLLPGAPRYRAYMQAQNGRLWDTTEHRTHLEYQSLLGDLVLESRFLGG
jgi:catechol O-methyltransferase